MKRSLVVLMLILGISCLFAEWSSDPSLNLRLTNSSYEEVIPKIMSSSNGDVWVSWFSAENGNYNVRVQRYNFNGEAQFAPEGILVSDNTQMSWLTDWDMKVDAQSNAILSFLDIRTGNQDIYVYKISPEGTFLWGEDGLALCNDELEDYTPTIGITDQNNVIVAWMAGSDIKLQKILADGSIVLAQPMIFTEEGYSHTWPQILPQENDSFILKYAKDSGPFYAVLRKVYAQKFDPAVEAIWATPTTITEMGGISSWTQIFSTASDGNGGFVICWYEDRDANQMRNVYIQHVLADGSVVFTPNGIEPTTSSSTQHFYPVTAYDTVNNISYVVWSETDANQNQRGLRAQAFDAEGNKMLGDDGMLVMSLGSSSPMPSIAEVVNSQLVALFTSALNGSTVDEELKAFKINSAGEFLWEGDFVTLNSTNGGIVHEEETAFHNNQLVAVWEDTRSTTTSIYLQNLHLDGTLGVQASPTGIQGTVVLNGGEGQVSDVIISIGDTQISPATNGTYYCEIPSGVYTVTAVLENYHTLTIQDVNIESGQITDLDMTLEFIIGTSDINADLNPRYLNNYPNPFNPSTTISFNLSSNDKVELTIYNIKGQIVKTLINEHKSAGVHSITWDGKTDNGKSVASGIYYTKLRTSKSSIMKKMLLVK